MATPKGQTPPVNLKERIAALQQRSVSPNTHQSAQAAPRGLPNAGVGGLRDKIAKFEEKGGMPVPRGSFGMGAPQLAENAPPKKRGELYGNRVPGLGRPSGAPVARSGSPLPSTDEVPGPRKRCISTGTGLSGAPSSFSTDEPVPALPNGVSGSAPRRNSLAVNFGSGRRVAGANDVDSTGVDVFDATSPSFCSLVPEKPPETTDEQLPSPGSAVEETLEVEEDQPSSQETPGDLPQPSESPPVVAPAEFDSNPNPFPIHDASQDSLRSPPIEKSNSDGQSDYESAPQSAVSQPSSSLPKPTSSVPPSDLTDTPPAALIPTPTPEKTVTVSLSTPLPEVTKQDAAPQGNATVKPAPDPVASVPSSIPTPSPTTATPPQTKPSFKVVVRRKVTELPISPSASSLAPPEPSQPTQQRRAVSGDTVQVPPSPGVGDLAVLLEEAAMLEMRLTEGEGASLKARELLAATPTSATFEQDPRHASASTLTEHAPMPSVDSGSQSMRSVSIPSIREPLVDGEIPEEDETDGRSLASTTFSQRSPSHRKYLSNIYRLTSRRSSGYMPGAYPRDSMSMSSEDSSPVTTPSDNGKRKGFGIGWPSASPKKGGPNVSRSSSFADKIFNRSRRQSNVSTADQASERGSLYESSQPTLTLSFPSELSAEVQADGVDMGARPTAWISPGDSNPEFSPASSLLDKDIFDAFPSVPETLPPGFHLNAENSGVGRASTLAVNGRKQVNQRLSML